MLTLDHAIVFTRDLAAAARQYERLGFFVTPRGGHPSLGTANHTIMLDRNYLELLTVVVPGPGNDNWAAAMAKGGGFGGLAFGTRDARATQASLHARGVAVPEVVDFERPVVLPNGTVAARFSVAHLPDDASPAVPAFFCQQHTPEYVWRPEYQRHPNTAFAVVGLTVVAREPAHLAPAYERLLGRAAVHPHQGGIDLDLRGTHLLVVNPQFAAARLGTAISVPADGVRPLGITVAVHRLAIAREVLSAGAIRHRRFGRASILVEPADAAGVYLELLEA